MGGAQLIRVFVYLAPLAVSIVAAWIVSDLVPSPDDFGLRVARWTLIAGFSTVILVLVDKLARHLLPLATLFGLTLAFPDQAPSRFRMALRNGSTTQLKARIADARKGKPVDTPSEAAERVLELVMALSHHDRLTRGHSERVRAYTQMIGEEMGLTAVELDRLRWSGLLHDIGKLRVSGEILNKPGKLTEAEFEEIKRHPEHGRELVAPLIDWLGDSARAVWEHHERWDGRGYPHGLAGTDISLAGRIVAVADTYDVITSVRSYKQAIAPADARAELTRCSGTQFDPVVVRAFMNLSLGRLRLAMGPLSWLAQLPLFPQALTAAATGAAPAATAMVGVAAASLGLGLSSDPLLPPSDTVVAEAPFVRSGRDPIEIDTGPRIRVSATNPGDASSPEAPADPDALPASTTTVASAPRSDETTTTTTTTSEPRTSETSTTTTTTLVGDDNPRATTPRVTTPTVTTPAITLPVTTVPDVRSTTSTTSTTRPPRPTDTLPTVTLVTLPTGTLPAVTLPVPVTSTTTTTPTTTSTQPATTTTTTTTVPPRAGWLPGPGVATPFYLDLPSSGVDLGGDPLMALVRPAPTAGASPDGDGDGRPGISIARNGRQASFALTAPTAARVAGPASAVVHAGSTGLLQLSVAVRARLMVCDATGACSVLAERSGSTLTVVQLVALPINLDFGSIDTTIPAGGTLRIVIDIPGSSGGDAVLLPDAAGTPSALTVRFP